MTVFYYLHVTADTDCRALVTNNGFPLLHRDLYRRTAMPAILNEALVKGSNELAVSILSAHGAGGVPARAVSLDIDIRGFRAGQVVTPDDGEPVLLTRIAPDPQPASPRVRAELPVSSAARLGAPRVWRFVLDGPDFSRLLKGPVVPVAEQALLSYGWTLLRLFVAGDLGGFLREFEPAARDQALALGQDIRKTGPQTGQLARHAMSLGLAARPEPSQLRTRSWCGGRIHELYLEPAPGESRPLIVTREDDEGFIQLPVYVAPVGQGGALRIVR